MAVLDVYTDSHINSAGGVDSLQSAINSAGGVPLVCMVATFEVAAADSDGSIYRLFKNVDPNLIPLFCMVANDAITGGTVWDLGLYKTGIGGAAISDACFASAMDLSTAHASWNPKTALDGLAALDVANINKRLFEIASETVVTRSDAYDIALTADTVGSAAGTVTVVLICGQG